MGLRNLRNVEKLIRTIIKKAKRARMNTVDSLGIKLAFEEAQKGYNEGGIPVGASLLDTATGKVWGQGMLFYFYFL